MFHGLGRAPENSKIRHQRTRAPLCVRTCPGIPGSRLPFGDKLLHQPTETVAENRFPFVAEASEEESDENSSILHCVLEDIQNCLAKNLESSSQFG